MEEARSFLKPAVIALVAAMRAMQLVLARDGTTWQPLTDAVDSTERTPLSELNARLEGRTEKLRNSDDPGLLAWHAWIVARFGGWHLANRSAHVRLR